MKNYYHILDVDYNATADEIKGSYRHLAKEYHPDANAGDRDKEEMFKLIGEAYHILSNEEKKASYDLSLLLHLNGRSGTSHRSNTWDIRQTRARRRSYYYRYRSPVVYSRRTHVAMAGLLVVIASAVLFVPLSLTRYSSEYHYDKGLEYFQNGQYFAALNSLDRSTIDFGSKDVEACLLAGGILMNQYGQYNYAIEYADKGLERAASDGERVQLLYLKGQCLRESTDHYQAIQILEEALTLWPAYDSLHYAIGEIYAFRLDKYEQGLQHFNRLLSVNADFSEGMFGKAYCHYKLGNYSEALINVDQYLQQSETKGSGYLLKGKILHRLHRTDQACDAWQNAARLGYNTAERMMNDHCVVNE